ncbi:microsomal glutathione S-transferase 2 isoform X2 [Dromiciops gliroides]|uniref:microsomal glutathione S-transferase 2 isoform X2 n=1 Tax=Dromiciops gliroides TaxID=33562 RepID=UPI001CC37B7F|nr:microsomal glutathione S-transferase 2 isoform X2 [Dromiciops gliroides]
MASDSVILAAVTILSICQQMFFVWKVGSARKKYKIQPPATSGSPAFERVFRAQQNSVEFFPLFLVTLWMAGWFFHQGLAALLGLAYIYARHHYFVGYSEAVQERTQTKIHEIKIPKFELKHRIIMLRNHPAELPPFTA